MNIFPPKGILITGPSGSGKTCLGIALCKMMKNELNANFYYHSSTEVIGGVAGESENNLRSK
jgi:SpoVK/Ycf46/Vps4 family AAA+-type ATPase